MTSVTKKLGVIMYRLLAAYILFSVSLFAQDNFTVLTGATVIDGTGKHITPGLIDCHSLL